MESIPVEITIVTRSISFIVPHLVLGLLRFHTINKKEKKNVHLTILEIEYFHKMSSQSDLVNYKNFHILLYSLPITII